MNWAGCNGQWQFYKKRMPPARLHGLLLGDDFPHQQPGTVATIRYFTVHACTRARTGTRPPAGPTDLGQLLHLCKKKRTGRFEAKSDNLLRWLKYKLLETLFFPYSPLSLDLGSLDGRYPRFETEEKFERGSKQCNIELR